MFTSAFLQVQLLIYRLRFLMQFHISEIQPSFHAGTSSVHIPFNRSSPAANIHLLSLVDLKLIYANFRPCRLHRITYTSWSHTLTRLLLLATDTHT